MGIPAYERRQYWAMAMAVLVFYADLSVLARPEFFPSLVDISSGVEVSLDGFPFGHPLFAGKGGHPPGKI